MAELTTIQKEIEARNVGLGRKLLAYEMMLKALKEAAFVLSASPILLDCERIAALHTVVAAIAKAEGKP